MAADCGFFVGWNRAVAGREQQAMEVFLKSTAWYGELVANGTIESFEPVLLSAHGGDINGFILIRGEGPKLDALRREAKFTELVTEAGLCLEGVGVVDCFVGAKVPEMMQLWGKLIPRDK